MTDGNIMCTSTNNIKTVSSNKEKSISYQENFKRYDKAKKSEFYLECLWILYSILEDRTSAFLYYLGFTSERDKNSVTGSKKIKQQIRQIFGLTDQQTKYNFNKIFGKLTRMQEVVAWSKNDADDLSEYLSIVKNAVVEVAEDKDFVMYLSYLNGEWRNKRNQLTHSLLNKDPSSAYSELSDLVDKGYSAVRSIDKAVSKLKRKNIRKKFEIQ